jgi:hypothetical protein
MLTCMSSIHASCVVDLPHRHCEHQGVTNQKGTGKGKAVQLSAAHDPTPQLVTAVRATDDANVWQFSSEPYGGGEWTARGVAARSPGGLVISALEVVPASSAFNGVTAAMLRKVPVGVILNHVRAEVARLSPTEAEQPQTSKAPRKGGRAALSDELLRHVAVAYLGETRPDKPTGALQRLAAEFERPEGTIRTWLAKARSGGWLGPGVKGRAGAEPGPRLRDLTSEEYTRIYSAQTTLDDQARAVAGAKGISIDEARQLVYTRAGLTPPDTGEEQ